MDGAHTRGIPSYLMATTELFIRHYFQAKGNELLLDDRAARGYTAFHYPFPVVCFVNQEQENSMRQKGKISTNERTDI